MDSPILPSQGGTGVINQDAETITLDGGFPLTLTLTGNTNVTLPTSGTLATTAQLNALIPLGTIWDYAGDAAQASPPSGWVYCNGQSLLRAGPYAPLFAVIGTTFGAADGTHFNLPNLQGYVTAGANVQGPGDVLDIGGVNPGGFAAVSNGNTGGEAAHLLNASGESSGALKAGTVLLDAAGSGNYDTSPADPTTAHNNIQPTMLMNKIIFTGV